MSRRSRTFRPLLRLPVVIAFLVPSLFEPPAIATSVPLTLTVSDTTVIEGTEPHGRPPEAFFTVTLSAPSSVTVRVAYETVPGTSEREYLHQEGVLTFSPGTTSLQVPAVQNPDCLMESPETFYLLLSDPVGALIADGVGIATVIDDDTTHLSIADATTTEGTYDPTVGNHTTVVSLTVTRDKLSFCDVSAQAETSPGTPLGLSPSLESYVVTFEPDRLTTTLTAYIPPDATPEPDEQIFVDLFSPTNAVISDGRAVLTVIDDDGGTTPTLPVLSVADIAVTEGAAGDPTTADVVVELSSPATADTHVTFTTRANMPGSDADMPEETLSSLTIAAGRTSGHHVIYIVDDKQRETTETFFVNLSRADGARIGDGQALATVFDDDIGVGFFIDDATVVEGTGADPTTAETWLRLTDPLPDGASVTFHVRGNTADTASDVRRLDVLVTLGPGQTAYQLLLPITADSLREPTESFLVYLSDVRGTDIADPEAVVTILDDDRAPTTLTYTGAWSGQYSDPVMVSATLGTGGSPVAGAAIEFKVGGSTVATAATDPSGSASATPALVNEPGTVATAEAIFSGDAALAPSSAVAPFSVAREDCTVRYTGAASSDGTTTLQAELSEPDTTLGDRSNKTLHFNMIDAAGVSTEVFALTDGGGVAKSTIDLAEGTYSVTPSFAGDAFYLSCVGVETFLVVSRNDGAGQRVTGGGSAASGGPVRFGFTAAIRHGTPSGQIQASFPTGARFHADSVSLLTVSGPTVTWEGSGRWNGLQGYTYQATATDDDRRGRRKGDAFTIVVRGAGGAIVASGGGTLIRGEITIH